MRTIAILPVKSFGAAKQELVTPDAYAGWAASALLQSTDPAERSLLERHEECARVYARLQDRYRAEKLPPAQAERKALGRLCHMLLCTNEFLYVG